MVKGVQVFTEGMSGYNHKNTKALNTAIQKLREMEKKAGNKLVVGNPTLCSGVSRYLQPPSVNEVNSIKVLSFELKAALALLNQDESIAEKYMKAATELEEETTFSYGPPNIVKPSFELYGEWLAEKGRKKEALAQFEKVLERAPKRRLAMIGMDKVR